MSLYIPSKAGVRIEDDILVTKTGYRILSKGRCESVEKVATLRVMGDKGHGN